MPAFKLLLSILTGFHLTTLTTAANPCGTEGDFLFFFIESFGSADHLPALGQEHKVYRITGVARMAADTAAIAANTLVLRLIDIGGNKFFNGTKFNPVDTYFGLTVRSGGAYLYLKQGIDREIMDIYVPGVPGTTTGRDNRIRFGIECTPDNASFVARNFTGHAMIIDTNDNHPVFYNASTNLVQSTFYGFVLEGTPPDTLAFEGTVARDTDGPLNRLTRVSVLENPYFKIKEQFTAEVRLYTKTRIEYEFFGSRNSTIDVLVIAVDSPENATMQLTSTATVVFTILKDVTLRRSVVLWSLLTAGGIAMVLAAVLTAAYLVHRWKRQRETNSDARVDAASQPLAAESVSMSANKAGRPTDQKI